MADRNKRDKETIEALYHAVLKLETMEDCSAFFEDLCTKKELGDMAQRLVAAKMLLKGYTYEQIVSEVEISTATISRINRAIQYGAGGYEMAIKRTEQECPAKEPPQRMTPDVAGGQAT